MDLEAGGYQLSGLSRISVILGKNGCGKSTALKAVENGLQGRDGALRYITPERGGTLTFDSNVEQNTMRNAEWMRNSRRVNQFGNFKQQTVVQYRSLETSVLRLMETMVADGRADEALGFQNTVDEINALLDNIEITRTTGPLFEIRIRESGQVITAEQISSGESELIALAIECLTFSFQVVAGGTNILFLDEPDVHLHPDLQERLTRFLVNLVNTGDFSIIMATHSTAIMGGLSAYSEASVAFMRASQTELTFVPIGDALKQVLPVFGAHPLSNVFNSAPVLILEGEDDVRMWQQAVRSSSGSIAVYPVDCAGLPNMATYENLVRDIAEAVYDSPRAYSLRDGDESPQDLDDLGAVTRLRLHCRAAENLMLSDEALARAGTDWSTATQRLSQWTDESASHPRHAEMVAFRDGGYDRRMADLKDIRMLVAAQGLAISRPWEVHVGQTIAELRSGTAQPSQTPDSILAYLGDRITTELLELGA